MPGDDKMAMHSALNRGNLVPLRPTLFSQPLTENRGKFCMKLMFIIFHSSDLSLAAGPLVDFILIEGNVVLAQPSKQARVKDDFYNNFITCGKYVCAISKMRVVCNKTKPVEFAHKEIDHIRIPGIELKQEFVRVLTLIISWLELACNGGSCMYFGGVSLKESPHQPQLQARSSPVPRIQMWPIVKFPFRISDELIKRSFHAKGENIYKQVNNIGGFRGGAEGAADPLFFLYFENVLRFCFENRFIKCSFILSSEKLTLLYFSVSRIRPQCCVLHVLKSEVTFSFWEEGGIFWIRP